MPSYNKYARSNRQSNTKLSITYRGRDNAKPGGLLSCSCVDFVSDTLDMCTQSRRKQRMIITKSRIGLTKDRELTETG
jgi:hypothetical protein